MFSALAPKRLAYSSGVSIFFSCSRHANDSSACSAVCRSVPAEGAGRADRSAAGAAAVFRLSSSFTRAAISAPPSSAARNRAINSGASAVWNCAR